MKGTVRILSLILSVITAVSLASCAEKEQNPDNTSEATAAVTTLPEETVNPLELEDPKLAALDWGGNDFTVGYNGNDLEPNLDFVSEGLNGALHLQKHHYKGTARYFFARRGIQNELQESRENQGSSRGLTVAGH